MKGVGRGLTLRAPGAKVWRVGKSQMMRKLLFVGLMLVGTPTWAAEAEAYTNYLTCVDGSAKKYSVLDQPITDIAEAALAACAGAFDQFTKAVDTEENLPRRLPIVNFAKSAARSKAIVSIADAKLATKAQ
jgi:hypothetical protein